MIADLFGEGEEQDMTEGKPAASKPPKAKNIDAEQRFEEAFRRLEEVVDEMERGELPLEQLLTRFEEGIELVKRCRAFLKQAQARVERFVEVKDGRWVLKDLD